MYEPRDLHGWSRSFNILCVSSTSPPLLPYPRDQLPDMDFPVNTMAEGRVLVPWEHQKYPNLTVQYTGGSSSVDTSFLPDTP